MKAYVPNNIKARAAGDNRIWVEAGEYPVVRQFDHYRYIIAVNKSLDHPVITLIEQSECMILDGELEEEK